MEKFCKPARSDDQLIAQLIARRLQVDMPEKVKGYLKHIGYYRLSGYMYPFLKRDGTDHFQDDTHFMRILGLYLFDKKLRAILLDMCERIEISVRTTICNVMALKHGPHWYLDNRHFRSYDHHQQFVQEVEEYCKDCHDPFIRHYKSKYNDPQLPPIWMVVQTLTFGQVSRLFDNMKACAERSEICYVYDLTPVLFESWLRAINFVRNCCAHHGRIWNRHVPLMPIIPTSDKFRFLNTVDDSTNKRVFGTISCMLYMLQKINPTSTCKNKLKALFREHPDVDLRDMGFVTDWEESRIWK